MRQLLLALLLVLPCAAVSTGQTTTSSPLIINRIALNQTHIAFSYAGDIWAIERGGGEARRLTTDPAEESFPFYSPDGSQLAFSRQVGGSWKLFVMAAAGGEARQLTYIPEDDLVMGWTPDGKSVLFQSHREEENLFRLFTMRTDGVMPEALPLPQAFAGSFAGDGARIAYTPMSSFGDWRFYRGGMESPIWIANVRDGSLEKLPHGDYNDRNPMWIENRIYFLSDRTGSFNLFVYDQTSKQTRQLTRYAGHGIRVAAAHQDAIAFVQAGRIHLFDLKTNQERTIDVRAGAESPELKQRTVNVSRIIDWATMTRDGDRVIYNARGEVISLNPKNGETENLTKTSGAAERYPSVSPDDKWLAYFSDEPGEYQLHVRALSGEGAVKKIAIEPKPSFYRELYWSPDSKKVAFTDKRLALWYADIERGTVKRIDTSPYSYQEEWYPKWSPDSRWLAYSRQMKNRVRTVFLYEVEAGRVHQVTDGRTDARMPVFDVSGKYLYFVSSPNAGTSEYGWGVLQGEFARPLVTRRVYALVLQKDMPAPLLPNGQPNPEDKFIEVPSPVRIDFENLGRRVIELPLAPRDYAELLVADKPGLLYMTVAEWPKSPSPGSFPTLALYRYDLTKQPKLELMVEDIAAYELTRDGKRLLYLKGRDWFLASTDEPPKADEGKLDLKKLEVTIEPREEWRQMYREAWRIMRDWFYDPGYHGQNLQQLEKDYEAYLPSVTRRSDFNNLMRQMLGHISVSHLGVGGGDTPPPAGGPSRIGLLGADYEIAENHYRFKKIYRSFSYNSPSSATTAPLDRPGVEVREGEYLLAVDGQKIDATKNLYTYFDGKVSKPVKITVGPNANGAGSRDLTVFPSGGENMLRRVNWAERNRRRVEELSGGRLGYIFVEGYGQGIMDFIRGLTGYSDKQGIIIDQRYNGGGITPDYLIEWLRRKPIYYYRFREGDDIATPVNPGPQTKVLLINEHNGSAAETFAFMYKLGKVGPIVGWRTYGAGIGPYVFTPRLIDGGRIQLPNRAAYDPNGLSWGIENMGVSPDYPVEITPRDWMAGRDPQLEKAVQVALDEMKRNPPVLPKRPKYPVHK